MSDTTKASEKKEPFHARYMFCAGQREGRKIETQEELDALGPEWLDHPPTEKDLNRGAHKAADKNDKK